MARDAGYWEVSEWARENGCPSPKAEDNGTSESEESSDEAESETSEEESESDGDDAVVLHMKLNGLC